MNYLVGLFVFVFMAIAYALGYRAGRRCFQWQIVTQMEPAPEEEVLLFWPSGDVQVGWRSENDKSAWYVGWVGEETYSQPSHYAMLSDVPEFRTTHSEKTRDIR